MKMGDRVSISFKKGDDESVALFHHWGGMNFVEDAKEYVNELRNKTKGKMMMPLDRLEPSIVMVDFIRELTKDMDIVESSIYLGKDSNDGDNSDNGHHIISLD